MRKTVDHEKMRQTLLDAAVTTVARFGIENCTSKKIAAESNLNEAYIFRYFLDLKDLRQKAFFLVEGSLFCRMAKLLVTFRPEANAEERRKKIFSALWQDLMENEKEVQFFVRYFLSTECRGEVLEKHFENCRQYLITGQNDSADLNEKARIGSAQLMTVLQYAAFVHGHLLEDSEETRNRILKTAL